MNNPRAAQIRMVGIELHGEAWSSEEFLAWLLHFPDAEAVGHVVSEEATRACRLAEGHYQRVSGRVAVLNPYMISMVAFIQGATFAAAAFGRPTRADEQA